MPPAQGQRSPARLQAHGEIEHDAAVASVRSRLVRNIERRVSKAVSTTRLLHCIYTFHLPRLAPAGRKAAPACPLHHLVILLGDDPILTALHMSLFVSALASVLWLLHAVALVFILPLSTILSPVVAIVLAVTSRALST